MQSKKKNEPSFIRLKIGQGVPAGLVRLSVKPVQAKEDSWNALEIIIKEVIWLTLNKQLY